MPVPDFSPGEVLTAAAMDSIGLWLVKTQAVGTGVSSVQVNNAFNADYENYKIIYSGGQSSTADNINLQLSVGGVASTVSYYGTLSWVNVGSAAVNGAADNNTTKFSFAGAGAGANDGAASMNFELLNPFETKRTRIHNAQVVYSIVYGTYTGLHDVGTSYDGFKLTPQGGTLTGGTIRVYGYRN
jgi:hypothetical protein